MNPKLAPVGVIYLEANEALRVWFLANHASADVLWVGFSDAEVARFRGNETAWADGERRPPGYRKTATHWVTSAKEPETREPRPVTLVEDLVVGLTIKPLTPTGRR